jgi:hypothetical protein
MTREKAIEFIQSTNGKFFTCEFTKRTTGELRTMLCRTGVKSGLKGGTLKFDPKEKDLIVVWDRQKKLYRMIPVDGLRRIKVRGKWSKING